jgi:hypothetical protein
LPEICENNCGCYGSRTQSVIRSKKNPAASDPECQCDSMCKTVTCDSNENMKIIRVAVGMSSCGKRQFEQQYCCQPKPTFTIAISFTGRFRRG